MAKALCINIRFAQTPKKWKNLCTNYCAELTRAQQACAKRELCKTKTLQGKDRIWKLLIQHITVFGAAEYTDVGLAWYKTSTYEHKAANSCHIIDSKHQKYSLGANRAIQLVKKFLAAYGTQGFITVYSKHIVTP